MSIHENLPEGWAIATIADLIAGEGIFNDGDWVESKDQDPSGEVRLIQLADIGDGQYRNKSARFLTMAKAEELGCTFLEPGDVLVARMPEPLGRACIFPGDEKKSVTVVDICIVRSGLNSVKASWLMHMINSPDSRASITELQSGTTRQRISRSNLATLKVPVPPLPEQTRIVAAIEKQFNRLDSAVASLQSAQAKTKQYRASLLKAAVEGELTSEWRAEHPTSETGAQLLARILAERRKLWEEKRLAEMRAKGRPPKDDSWKLEYNEPQGPDVEALPELPEGWCWATMEQLSDERRAITYGVVKLGDPVTGGIPTLRSSNVRHLKLAFEGIKSISPAIANEYKRTFLQGNEILVTVRGTLGGVAIVPSNCTGYNISREVAMIAFVWPSIAPYLVFFIGSPSIQNWITQNTKGIAYTGVNIETLKSMPAPFIPLAEQAQIVAEVEARLSEIAQMEETIEHNLRRVELERQSILREAFAGRLVEQHAEDEPASVLLERIREERRRRAEIEQIRRKREPGMGSLKKHTAYKAGKGHVYRTLLEAERSLEPQELFKQAGLKSEDQPEAVATFYKDLFALISPDVAAIEVERPDEQKIVLKVREVPPEVKAALLSEAGSGEEDRAAPLMAKPTLWDQQE